MKNVVTLVILFYSFFTFSQSDSSFYIKRKTYQGVLMSDSSAVYSLPKNCERFIPDIKDIELIEQSLYHSIDNISRNEQHQQFYYKDKISNHLIEYNRQYYGYINSDGQKVIFINLFKLPIGKHTDDELIVMDGCDSFFQIRFNIDTQQFFGLLVNGCA